MIVVAGDLHIDRPTTSCCRLSTDDVTHWKYCARLPLTTVVLCAARVSQLG